MNTYTIHASCTGHIENANAVDVLAYNEGHAKNVYRAMYGAKTKIVAVTAK